MVTYWLAPGRRVILLTVFRKTRGAEVAQLARALYAREICEGGRPGSRNVRPRGADISTRHDSYEDVARHRRASSRFREGYAEAQRAFRIGQAVCEWRLALGLSQAELARRTDMTQPALSRLEAGLNA